jgi:DNA repair photolyase
MNEIGITEASDPAFDHGWTKWAIDERKPTILITKNIKKLLTDFPGLENQNNIIFHATITGYGGTFIEPNVPKPLELTEFLHTVQNKERFVIRIDPIICLKLCVRQAKRIKDELSDFSRFRVSILDLYPHARERFKLVNSKFYDDLRKIYGDKYIHADCDLRKAVIEYMGDVSVCGEPGIPCEGCISQKDLDILGLGIGETAKFKQREFCACLAGKHELLKNKKRCQHMCAYCYHYDK